MTQKFCIFCPDNCRIEGDHHHFKETPEFDSHQGKTLPKEIGGLGLEE